MLTSENVCKPPFATFVKHCVLIELNALGTRNRNKRSKKKGSWCYWERILWYERISCIHVIRGGIWQAFLLTQHSFPSHRPSIPKQCHHPNLWSFTAFKPYHLFDCGYGARDVEMHFLRAWTVWSRRWVLRAMSCAVPALRADSDRESIRFW